MATLGNIRKHGVALIVIVGLAMLAFIVGDFLSSGTSYFNRKREYVGEIEGQKIHFTEYEAAKEQLTEVYKIETGRSDFDEDMTAQLRNQVWQMMLQDYALQAQAKKIGMTVTKAELEDLCIGDHIHQIILGRRAFYDQNGQFNRAYLLNFLGSLEQEAETAEQQANIDQAKQYWMYWENAVRITRLQEKYTDLLQKCVTANSLDAKFAFNAAQTSVNVQYVMKPYYAVADSLVKVSDKDIKALYNKKKEQYKQEPNRAIEYVSFPVVPSEADYAAAEEAMKKVQEEFYTTEDLLTVVNVNSDVTYNGMNLGEQQVPEQYREFAFGKQAKAGDVTELTFADNTYSMARLVKAGYALPDSVQLKGIATQEGQEDQELGWFTEADLTKDMAEKAFAAKKGDRFTVAIGVGEQTFEVMDFTKPMPKVQLAIMARNVTASSKTYAQIFNEAKQFVVANPSQDKFEAAAKEAGMAVRPAANLLKTTDKVADLKQSRPIVRWAFEAKDGAVSDVFECGDQFIVAALSEVNESEYRTLEQVTPELRYEALNNKKAEYIQAELAGVNSLEEAAQKLEAPVQEAEGVTLASYRLGQGGVEPAVIGAALKLNNGELSAPVQGVAGVYVVKGGEKVTSAAEFNKEQEVMQLNSRTSYSLPYMAMQLVEEKANVVDNRANFQ